MARGIYGRGSPNHEEPIIGGVQVGRPEGRPLRKRELLAQKSEACGWSVLGHRGPTIARWAGVSPQGPRRLESFDYVGPHAYLLTICTRGRVNVLLDRAFAQESVKHLLRLSAAEYFALPAYCLMPDHLRVLGVGVAASSNPRTLMHRWKAVTAFAWRRQHSRGPWQRGFHDRVLRNSDRLLAVARYVLMNPVRAGLVTRAKEYAFSGSTEYAVETILRADEWTPS